MTKVEVRVQARPRDAYAVQWREDELESWNTQPRRFLDKERAEAYAAQLRRELAGATEADTTTFVIVSRIEAHGDISDDLKDELRDVLEPLAREHHLYIHINVSPLSVEVAAKKETM